MGRVKSVAFGALCTALIVLFFALSLVFPSLDLTLSALAALVIYILLLEFGKTAALLSFFSAGVLSLLLLPNRWPALFFLFFFGWYPFLRTSLKKVSVVVAWVLKIGSVSIAGFLFWLLFAVIFPSAEFQDLMLLPAALLLIVTFVLYDIGLSKLLNLYLLRLRPKLFGK